MVHVAEQAKRDKSHQSEEHSVRVLPSYDILRWLFLFCSITAWFARLHRRIEELLNVRCELSWREFILLMS
jgi:hypothetical protein